MKRFLQIFLAAIIVLSAPTSYGHEYESVPVIPTFDQCETLTTDACPEYREYLLNLLLELIQAIKEARAEKAGIELDEVEDIDLENIEEFDRVVVDMTRSEIRNFKDSTYRVLSNGTLSGQSRGDIPDVTLAIWNDFRLVASDKFIEEYVVSFRAYYDDSDAIAAQVRTSEDDYRKWELVVNVAAYQQDPSDTKEYFLRVLIHEFGHFLTLNDEQLDLTARTSSCGTYFVQDQERGCFYANSYVNLYVDDFWGREDFERSKELSDIENVNNRLERADRLHRNLKDEFVTAYAMTEVEEDIAESFTYYVYEDEPEGDTELEEKWLFFHRYSDLRDIREEIRDMFPSIF